MPLLPGSSVVSRFIGGASQPLTGILTWGTGAGGINHVTGPTDQDLIVGSGTGRNLILQNDSTVVLSMDGASALFDRAQNVNYGGSNLAVYSASSSAEELTGMVGASVTTTGLIPAGAMILGVTSRVNTTITGATTFDVGDGTDIDAFGAALPLVAGSITDFTDYTIVAPLIKTAASEIVLTANGGNFTAGVVNIVVWYVTLTAPSS